MGNVFKHMISTWASDKTQTEFIQNKSTKKKNTWYVYDIVSPTEQLAKQHQFLLKSSELRLLRWVLDGFWREHCHAVSHWRQGSLCIALGNISAQKDRCSSEWETCIQTHFSTCAFLDKRFPMTICKDPPKTWVPPLCLSIHVILSSCQRKTGGSLRTFY